MTTKSNPYGFDEGVPIHNIYSISPQDMIKTVLDQCKDLHWLGYDEMYETEDEVRMEPFLNRPDDFLITVNWIMHNLVHMKKMNTSSTSYTLKHLMEDDIGLYVTNGMFICAMLAERYTARPIKGGPNVNFNTRKAKITEIEKRLREGYTIKDTWK